MNREAPDDSAIPHIEEQLAGWGNFPRVTCRRYRPARVSALPATIRNSATTSLVARGAGRSYGDASLNSEGGVVDARPLDRFLELDVEQGILRAEAGVTVGEVLRVTVPRGWFLPVVPGTRFPTLGGLLAADVHGKNHHKVASFQRHVRSMTLFLASGEPVTCSADERGELFAATAGGMGLTGIIAELEVALQPIQSAAIRAVEQQAPHLGRIMELLSAGDERHQYSVGWIDGMARGAALGRGTVLLGDHAFPADLDSSWKHPLALPTEKERPPPPGMALLVGRFAVTRFNALRYGKAARARSPRIEDYASYFFPLDAMRDWNSLYGKGGFVQYQCVIPFDDAHAALARTLETLQERGHPSYLVVLKRFGEGCPMLSFPQPGWTIALDIPVRNGLLPVLDELDRQVVERGGRVYLAKDARLAPEMFREMYPELDAFLAVKREVDPEDRFSSDLARRLGLTSAS